MRPTRPETAIWTPWRCRSPPRRRWWPWRAAPEDPLAIRLLDPVSLTELPQQLAGLPTGVVVQDLAVSRDGRYLGASFGHLVIDQRDGRRGRPGRSRRCGTWSPRQPVGRQIDPPLSFTRLALSDDGATMFTSNPVSAYDVATGRVLWQGNEAWTGDVDARGRVVAAFTEDGTAVQLLNTDNGLVRTTLTGQTGLLQDVSFSPDGSTLAATSADGLAVVWDTSTGRTLHRFDTGAGAATGVSYSPDATTLYVGKPLTREVQAWDLSGDRRFLSKIGFGQIAPYGTGMVELSPGGTRIARGGWRPDPAEASLGLFDTRTGVEVHPPLVSQSWSVGGGWSPDGREFVTGYADGLGAADQRRERARDRATQGPARPTSSTPRSPATSTWSWPTARPPSPCCAPIRSLSPARS